MNYSNSQRAGVILYLTALTFGAYENTMLFVIKIIFSLAETVVLALGLCGGRDKGNTEKEQMQPERYGWGEMRQKTGFIITGISGIILIVSVLYWHFYQFWRKFNSNLKKSYLLQSGNWIKYAFMERRNGKLFYFCSIPKRNVIPDNFVCKEIQHYKYLVAEHIGSMNKLYETYKKIYQEILPDTDYILLQDRFLHFERYDYRFHWNMEDSIIEIWIPIES